MPFALALVLYSFSCARARACVCVGEVEFSVRFSTNTSLPGA